MGQTGDDRLDARLRTLVGVLGRSALRAQDALSDGPAGRLPGGDYLLLGRRGVGWSFERLRSPPRLVPRQLCPRVAASSDRVNPFAERACALSGEHSLLEVIEVREDGRVRVRLRGELDLAGVPTLAGRLGELRGRRERVLLDLDELEFIDMSGLRVVLAAAADASSDGWAFTITPGSAAVRRLIALVRLDRQLPLDESSG